MIEVVRGDITTQRVDAIVNAANASLLGGGGVDGAIHRAGGPAILAECRALGGCETGDAKATTARRAGRALRRSTPSVRSGAEARPARRSCSRRATAARSRSRGELGARSVAFPAISCGLYGYPPELAAPVALDAVRAGDHDFDVVRFVLFGERHLRGVRTRGGGLTGAAGRQQHRAGKADDSRSAAGEPERAGAADRGDQETARGEGDQLGAVPQAVVRREGLAVPSRCDAADGSACGRACSSHRG